MDFSAGLTADDPALVRRIEHASATDAVAVATVLAGGASSTGVAVQPWCGGQLVALGPGAYVNRGIGVGLDGPVRAADLRDAVAFFVQRNLPAQLEVTPFADASLLDALAHVPTSIVWFRHVLGRSLTPGDRDFGDDLVSAEIVDDALVSRWQAVHRAAAGAEGVAADVSDTYAAAAHAVEGATDLLGTIDGQIVGAASMIVREGRALFGGAATLPEHRGRGVHSALVRIRLARAARQGCDLAVASAEPGSASARNLERNGFTVLYTMVCVEVASS